MRSFGGRCLLAAILLVSCVSCGIAQSSRKPLTDRELMALVAGGAVGEDIAAEIDSRGLAFHAGDPYRSLIATAGGDAVVLEALTKAKIFVGSGQTESGKSTDWLEHLAKAGKLVRGKQIEEAATELDAAIHADNAPEAGFVMGNLLSQQGQWREAAQVYAEVLRQDPDFTVAHAKLSYALHRLDDPEGALREAKSALAESPKSAEAHRNAGIALDDLKKSDAAEQEYREALRLKPDYAIVHYDMGVSFEDRNSLDQAMTEYKKSIVLDPQNEKAHYNLGKATTIPRSANIARPSA
jgi:tetratricopeptide (TPR) repeat protein